MLRTLISSGIDEATPPLVAKRLRMANQVTLFQIAVSLFFACTAPLLPSRDAAIANVLLCGSFVCVYLLVLWLMRRRQHVAARILLLVAMNVGLAGTAVLSDAQMAFEGSLLALAPLPLLLFGREDRRANLLGTLLPMGLYFGAVALRSALFPAPPFGASPPGIRWLAAASTFGALLWQLAVLHRENARSEEAIGRARDLALEASRQKSEFLANMSHEVRTPLTAILGYADLLADTCAGDELTSVETIRRNGRHLLGVLSDILDLSKIEAGRMEVERIPCAVGSVVMEVAALMRLRAQERRLDFQVRYLGPVPETIHSDPTRLRQILLNLVGNAIKFTASGGVSLEVQATPAGLRFAVRDTGIGMSEADLGRLFQPFTQADASMTRRFGGTGLGLVICQRLAGMLGGGIEVTSEPGRGSCFTVTVDPGPLTGVRLLERPEAGAAPAPAPRTPPANPLAGAHVLLAEDGRDNQLLISTILRRAGAQVTLADNGRAALDKALEAEAALRPFSLVLMDMQMPELDGYEATAALRRAGYPQPIVALTAHAMAGDRDLCLAAGCDDYLTKPVEQPLLVEIARRLLAGRA